MASTAPKADVTVARLLEQALALPAEQRLLLAEQLCESAEMMDWPSDVHSGWKLELEQRLLALVRGSAATVDGAEQLRRLRVKFGT